MELHSKAWIINTSNFDEPWFAPDGVYYAESRSKARSKALKDVSYGDYKDHDGELIGFLNLKLKREKAYDIFLVNGVKKTAKTIEYDKQVLEKSQQLDKLLADNPGSMAYIKKGGYLYRPNSCGYTEHRMFAGVYTIEEAIREVRGCSIKDNMDVVLIDQFEHNKMLLDEIADLQTRVIK